MGAAELSSSKLSIAGDSMKLRAKSTADVLSRNMSVAPASSECSWKRSISPDGGRSDQLDCFGTRLVGEMGQAKDHGSGKPHDRARSSDNPDSKTKQGFCRSLMHLWT